MWGTIGDASTDSVDSAVSYLLQRQDVESGLWSINSSRVIIDTAESILAIRTVGDPNDLNSLSTSELLFDAILANVSYVTAFESLKLIISQDGNPSNLLTLRNADGGWGAMSLS